MLLSEARGPQREVWKADCWVSTRQERMEMKSPRTLVQPLSLAGVCAYTREHEAEVDEKVDFAIYLPMSLARAYNFIFRVLVTGENE